MDGTTTDKRIKRRKAQIKKIFGETATKLENHRSGTEAIEETN